MFGLLTRIRLPGAKHDIVSVAKQQHLFPLVGLVLGLLLVAACLILSQLAGRGDSALAGGILLVVMYALTGIMHTEGLADVADGMMAGGTHTRKREIMKDPHSGVGAVFAVSLYLIILFTLSWRMCARADDSVDLWPLPWQLPFAIGFVLSEIGGKMAMNTSMTIGPSSHGGMGSVFVEHSSPEKFVAALAIGLAASIIVAGFLAVIIVVGVIAGMLVTMLARSHFGGVSGDVFGAANDIGRLSVLITWVLII